MKDREYMLDVIWRSIPDHQTPYTWMDGTRSYFFCGIKLEDVDGKKEMYSTVSSIYKIMPTHAIWYAYKHGMDKLSNSVRLTVYTDRINNKKVMQAQQTVDNYVKRIQKLENSGTINLNQIKEKYEQQQRENH